MLCSTTLPRATRGVLLCLSGESSALHQFKTMPPLLGTSDCAHLLFWLNNLLVTVQPAPEQSIQVRALPIQWHSSAAMSPHEDQLRSSGRLQRASQYSAVVCCSTKASLGCTIILIAVLLLLQGPRQPYLLHAGSRGAVLQLQWLWQHLQLQPSSRA